MLNEFFGFESGSSVYGSRDDSVVNFAADVEKRDAVVKAFKVRDLMNTCSPSLLSICFQHAWLAYGTRSI